MDETLLVTARRLLASSTDAALLDEALAALLARYRAAEIDGSYSAYDEHPLSEADEWGISPRFAALQQRREPSARAGRSVVVRAVRDRSQARCSALAERRNSETPANSCRSMYDDHPWFGE